MPCNNQLPETTFHIIYCFLSRESRQLSGLFKKNYSFWLFLIADKIESEVITETPLKLNSAICERHHFGRNRHRPHHPG